MPARSRRRRKPQAPADAHARIDALNISGKLKKNLHFVHDNLKGTKFGFPDYGLKGTAVWQTFSVWACLFSCFYYFVKGMWRKGLVLLLAGTAVNIAGSILAAYYKPAYINALGNLGTLTIAVIAMQSAYHDIYRKGILKQQFWW